MPLTDAQLDRILVEQNYLSKDDVQRALKHVRQHGGTLKGALFELGLLTQELYESAIAEHYRLPYYNIQKTQPPVEMMLLLPEDIARTFSSIVVDQRPEGITVATSDPQRPNIEEAVRLNFNQKDAVFPETTNSDQGSAINDQNAVDKKEEKTGVAGRFPSLSFSHKKAERAKYAGKVQFVYTPQSSIEMLLVHYRKPLTTRFQSIIDTKQKVAPEILEEIINDAIEHRASDIHFEPQEKLVLVRFRVDGVMHVAGKIPKEYYEGVVNRIKIEANMRIDEHFATQDGAIRYGGHGEPIDIRVSIVPLIDGEKVVMRILSTYVRSITLTDLGFSEQHQKVLEVAAYKPFGMILTTGPTGSGKSTTLYALMKMRNHPDINISTIEDPVEYKIQGINHIQVNLKTDLTFAKGLRALVRQDPNVILVGEIRDGETADIAVNAALTGHLLFSTLHANDAATAIPRLLDMGVEPFLLASTLEVVLAQRLVRRLCPQCRYSYSVVRKDIEKIYPGCASLFSETEPTLLYRGKGCENCGSTGYKGRVGIYELLVTTPEIKELIIKRVSSAELNAMARSQGMRLLFDDGFEKVRRGVTSLEELFRVAAPPDSYATEQHESR